MIIEDETQKKKKKKFHSNERIPHPTYNFSRQKIRLQEEIVWSSLMTHERLPEAAQLLEGSARRTSSLRLSYSHYCWHCLR